MVLESGRLEDEISGRVIDENDMPVKDACVG